MMLLVQVIERNLLEDVTSLGQYGIKYSSEQEMKSLPTKFEKEKSSDLYISTKMAEQEQHQKKKVSLSKALTLELIEPSADTIESGTAANIVNDESTDGAAVIGRGDGAKPFLAGSIPNLSLNLFAINIHNLSLEFNADGGLGMEIELVSSITRQQIGFTNRRVSDDDDLEEILLTSFIVRRRHCVGFDCARLSLSVSSDSF